MERLKAIYSLLFGKYVVIKENGVNILVQSNLTEEGLKETACKFFRLVYISS